MEGGGQKLQDTEVEIKGVGRKPKGQARNLGLLLQVTAFRLSKSKWISVFSQHSVIFIPTLDLSHSLLTF